ncbi:hypothetical protein PVL29_013921 [Vitis rotundifolia]|uniref:Uncharacterized protein n=1 Tax=Vitis rotundifolia TaxID=103349 RepID=A0AA38ZGK2_VITRO|nr:hypothetical protein PVL29_013921 [Vitis rotundifolia]
MEAPSWVVLALAWQASVALLSKVFSFRPPHKQNLPSGPTPWPIIGNLNLIGRLPHQSLHKLSQKYGQIMELRFGSPSCSGLIFRNGKANHSNITWAPYGPYWRQGRKIFLTELFSSERLESYEHIRVEERRAFIFRLYALSGRPVMLKEHLSRVTLSVISRIVLGEKYFSEFESGRSMVTVEECQKMLGELFLLNGVLNIGDWIPWIAFLHLQGYLKRMKALRDKFDRFYDHVLEKHRARREAEDFVAKDMVDMHLRLADDPDLEDLIAGGTDTSATTLEWAMSEVLREPNIAKKATEELDRVIGRDRWAEEKDIPQLPYIDAIVKETMRLHPIVIVVKGQSFELLPFGSGRRMCPGYSLGLKMIQSSLANMLHGFHWKLPGDMKTEELNMEEVFGLTTPRSHLLLSWSLDSQTIFTSRALDLCFLKMIGKVSSIAWAGFYITGLPGHVVGWSVIFLPFSRIQKCLLTNRQRQSAFHQAFGVLLVRLVRNSSW